MKMTLLFILLIMLSSCTGWLMVKKTMHWETINDTDVFQHYGLHYDSSVAFDRTLTHEPHVAIFIHAMVGVFPKKRGGGTWGHGGDILFELLSLIQSTGLIEDPRTRGVFVGLLGSTNDCSAMMASIRGNFSSKVRVSVWGENTELSEFPILHLMQSYSSMVHPDSKLLYVHTKGVRRNGIGDYPAEWRQYMSYFVVERFHDLCSRVLEPIPSHLQAPQLPRQPSTAAKMNTTLSRAGVVGHERVVVVGGFETCGPLKKDNIYGGNFWWSRAAFLSRRRPMIRDLEWSIPNRFAAEEYLLRDESPHRLSGAGPHYCLHHAHHDMGLCHTPRKWYADINVTLRSSANCFSHWKRPKNQRKNNASSWCHHFGLPHID